MRVFEFDAMDLAGRTHTGRLEVDTRAAALAALHDRALVPVDLRVLRNAPARGSTRRRLEFRWTRAATLLSVRELGLVAESLGALLQAGLNVDRALGIARSLAEAEPGRALLTRVAEAVRAGQSLTSAWAASGQPLPRYFLSMVEAGESSGRLPQALSRLAELIRYQLEIRERVRSALTYPAILCAVVLLTLGLLLGFVLPRFEALFEESEAAIPWVTQVVMGAGRFVADYGLVLALVAAVAVGAGVRSLRSASGRRRVDGWLLRSRLTLGLVGALNTARVFQALATLLASGMTLSSAMRVAKGTLDNTVLREAFQAATTRVNAGEAFGEALADTRVFPGVAVQLARVGEETGQLPDMLSSASTLLERDARARLERLLTALVPAVTIAMGLIVAALVGSVLIGLLSLNDLAG